MEDVVRPSGANKMVKIILVGDATVGKTSLRRSFAGEPIDDSYSMTTGTEFSIYREENRPILQIYDLAGQANFRAVRQNYYKGSQGALLVFDVVKPKTFKALDTWMQELLRNIDHEIPLVVVGNKIDLREEVNDGISTDLAEKWVKNQQVSYRAPISYVETSAKDNLRVNNAFNLLVNKIVEN